MKTALLRLFVGLLGLAGGPAVAQEPAQVSAALPPALPPAVRHALDSMQALLRRPGLPDTTRVQVLDELCWSLIQTDLVAAQRYGTAGVALAHRIGYTLGEARLLNDLGTAMNQVGDYRASLRYCTQALPVALRTGHPRLIGHVYLGLGNASYGLTQTGRAIAFFQQARQAYARHQPAALADEARVLNNLATLYSVTGQLAKAAAHQREALRLARQAPDEDQNRPTMLQGLAVIEEKQGHLALARTLNGEALALARRQGDVLLQSRCLSSLASLALAAADAPLALRYARQSAALARKAHSTLQLRDALEAQCGALRQLGQLAAYDTLARVRYLDSLMLDEQTAQATAQAQVRFDVAGQQARITGLEKDRRIRALEAERRATRTRLLATGGTLAAGLLLAGITLAYRRRQRRQEAQLRERLAADLHDDLGPLLTQLAVESSLLRENVYAPDQLLARLRHLGETSQQAAQHLGAVLRDLDAGPAAAAAAPLAELVNELREHAHEALSPHEMGLTLTLADLALAGRLLPAATRHALALIFREALHNVVKHAAGATLVRATIGQESDGLLLTLQDDGRLGPAAATARPGGRGLRSMHTRAEALGGWLTAAPGPGGFAVRAWLPG